jgi:hypothetical protein
MILDAILSLFIFCFFFVLVFYVGGWGFIFIFNFSSNFIFNEKKVIKEKTLKPGGTLNPYKIKYTVNFNDSDRGKSSLDLKEAKETIKPNYFFGDVSISKSMPFNYNDISISKKNRSSRPTIYVYHRKPKHSREFIKVKILSPEDKRYEVSNLGSQPAHQYSDDIEVSTLFTLKLNEEFDKDKTITLGFELYHSDAETYEKYL